MTTVCQLCGKKSWNVAFVSAMYRCDNCLKLYHGKCLDNPGYGIIRRGHCPNCGSELQLSQRLDESSSGAESGPSRDATRVKSNSDIGIGGVIVIIIAIVLAKRSCSTDDAGDSARMLQMAAIQSAISSRQGMCTNNGVNLRARASRSSAVRLELPKDAPVDVKERKGMWVKVSYTDGSSSVTGYISGELLKPCD